jgi:AcrR family transcriptional regulator
MFVGRHGGRVTVTGSRQEERSRSTRLRLLAATVDCLVDRGWSGTTTTVVAERAGLSRGAQLHHYPTKSALVIAAVQHLADRRAAELRAEVAALPGGNDRIEATVDLLASIYTGPLFVAALEVWMAARTDATLRAALVPVEARVGREVHRFTVELLGADESRPGVRETVQATLDLLRGLGVANLLTDDSHRRARLLAVWKHQLTATLDGASRADPASRVDPPSPVDLPSPVDPAVGSDTAPGRAGVPARPVPDGGGWDG